MTDTTVRQRRLKPTLLVDGKKLRYKYLTRTMCERERPPIRDKNDPQTWWARCEPTGEQWAMVHFYDGTRDVFYGRPERTVGTDGREVYAYTSAQRNMDD